MTINRRASFALALIAAVALSQTVAGAASADDIPATIQFNETSTTIEYGQYWTLPVTMDREFFDNLYTPSAYTVATTGAPGSYAPVLSAYANAGTIYAYLDGPYETAPLGAGSYTFSISGTAVYGPDTVAGTTPVPATVTITKAKLGVEVRMLADPSNGDAAIVTAKFTGRFIDEYQSSFFPASALSPAGTWQITVKDSSGQVAIERNIERVAGDDVLATSFYWADAEPGEQYTASASFTPSGASASNFTVSAASTFPYTAPEAQRPVPTSTATDKPDAALPEATGFGLPLWLLITGGVLFLALGTLIVLFAVRLNRRPVATVEKVAAK